MQTEWQIRRRTVAQTDGQRRWDLTYQCLLRWARQAQATPAPLAQTQEEQNASSSVCTCIDAAAGTNADD